MQQGCRASLPPRSKTLLLLYSSWAPAIMLLMVEAQVLQCSLLSRAILADVLCRPRGACGQAIDQPGLCCCAGDSLLVLGFMWQSCIYLLTSAGDSQLLLVLGCFGQA
jgi:hypothetical protein